jgi:hypothetical protein
LRLKPKFHDRSDVLRPIPSQASNTPDRLELQCWDHGCNGRQFLTFYSLLRHQSQHEGREWRSADDEHVHPPQEPSLIAPNWHLGLRSLALSEPKPVEYWNDPESEITLEDSQNGFRQTAVNIEFAEVRRVDTVSAIYEELRNHSVGLEAEDFEDEAALPDPFWVSKGGTDLLSRLALQCEWSPCKEVYFDTREGLAQHQARHQMDSHAALQEKPENLTSRLDSASQTHSSNYQSPIDPLIDNVESLEPDTPSGSNSDGSFSRGSSESIDGKPLLSPEERKTALVDRLMNQFFFLFNSRTAYNDRAPDSQQKSRASKATTETKSSVLGGSSASSIKQSDRKHSRPNDPQEGLDTDEDEEDRRLPKRSKDRNGNGPASSKRRKLACPYFKRNPRKYQNCRSCVGPGWESTHRMK